MACIPTSSESLHGVYNIELIKKIKHMVLIIKIKKKETQRDPILQKHL